VRAAFAGTVIGAGLIFWVARYPPMADLPQHAGQLAALRDLLAGTSPWESLLRVNPFTPYLIGYVLALPLSYVLPIAEALKLLLSLSFYAFMASYIVLRRHFGADARLDWLAIPGFFGFAYVWGFFTFLLAVPLCLLFIWLADRHAREPALASATILCAVGVLLFFSHGLCFLFAVATSAVICVLRGNSWSARIRLLAPFIPLALLSLAYAVSLSRNEANVPDGAATSVWWDWMFRAFVPVYIFGVVPEPTTFPLTLLVSSLGALVLFLSPLLLGSAWNGRHAAVCIPFTVLVLAWLSAPDQSMRIAFTYHRFALFILPLFALMFRAPRTLNARHAWRDGAIQCAMAGVCWASLFMHADRAARTEHERRDFDAVRLTMEPAQRVLYMAVDARTEAADNEVPFLHYAVWYQAENRGLVDYNFAWAPSQVVRYRLEQLPAVSRQWRPQRFDWTRDQGWLYRYFVIRHAEPLSREFFQNDRCAVEHLRTAGRWSVYEVRSCMGSTP
jgi:hypothetical protein